MSSISMIKVPDVLITAGSYILDVTAFSGKAVHTHIGFLVAIAQFVSTSLYAGLVNIL